MRLSLLFCLVGAALGTTTKWHELKEKNYDFKMYVEEFGKSYDSSEYAVRKAIFEERLEAVHAHNSRQSSWKEGVNHMTDRTDEERSALLGYKKSMGYASRGDGVVSSPSLSTMAVPESFDWRDHGAVSAVKDQGQCGSCWTFASAETVESHYFIKTGLMKTLSTEQIASCTANPGNCGGSGGCNGGIAELAFDSITKIGGLASEWTYPYNSWHGQNSECKFNETLTAPEVKLTGFTKLPSNEYEPLIEALVTQGPIAISVDASTWHNYESGIYDGCNQESPDLDHAVQLVGYGTDADGDYWTVRNSWTTAFGEAGYIRVARHATDAPCGTDVTPQDGSGCDGGPEKIQVCGTCGILYDNCYPIVA